MAENIFVAVIAVFAVGAADWSWWYENHGTDADD